jgi:hypothetical protein
MRCFVPALLLLTAAAQPASQSVDWHWVRDTPMCSLRQAYSADNVIILSGTPANANYIYVGGVEPILATSKNVDGGKFTFFPGGELDAEIAVTQANGRRDITASSDDPAFMAKFAGASAVEVTQEQLGKTRVPLRSASAAVDAIRSCEDSRMRDWGMDPVAWRALKSRPSPLAGWEEWINSDDYPIDALLSGSEGYMILRLQIGADGSVQDCQRLIRGRLVEPRLRICSKLKRLARFSPAVASNGATVPSLYALVIKFRLE